jgi:hypothetical protein
MVIRFACPHCQQRLTVSARKAGASATCPRCKQAVTIPSEPAATPANPGTGAAREAALSLSLQAPHSERSSPPLPQIIPYDERPELIYEIEEYPHAASTDIAQVDFDRVSVPRWALYLQGGLLAGVALVSFILGVLMGGSLGGSSPTTPGVPQPCEVSGVISVATAGGKEFPDDGAVVIALPHDEHPDERAPVEGLRPEDTDQASNVRGTQMIELWRGGITRTDLQGRYRLRLPDRGKYFVLVISHHSPRSREKPPETAAMQQMGRFFESPSDLVGGKSYSWELKPVRGDVKLNKIFD